MQIILELDTELTALATENTLQSVVLAQVANQVLMGAQFGIAHVKPSADEDFAKVRWSMLPVAGDLPTEAAKFQIDVTEKIKCPVCGGQANNLFIAFDNAECKNLMREQQGDE